ncbi:MAG: hypothetical protein HY556_02240 [Euryarchaeota archaeon]|nr:hypothetical protein [Euryarchaeota archaeon]
MDNAKKPFPDGGDDVVDVAMFGWMLLHVFSAAFWIGGLILGMLALLLMTYAAYGIGR